MTKTQLDKARELLNEILDYEDDVYALGQLEATIYFILEGQDEYTRKALALVMENLREAAKRIDEMYSKAIELAKTMDEGDER